MFVRILRVLLVASVLSGCGNNPLFGTLGGVTASSTPSGVGFAAVFILASVSPTPFVPAAGIAQKSVIGQCVDIRADGTMIQSILYTQDSPAQITRETDTWKYTLVGSDIITADPLAGTAATPQRIGATTDSQIVITRILRNDGAPVVRTLTFSKVASLSTPCGT